MTATAAEPARVQGSLWRPMVLAMGKTGGASIASGLLSALGTKVIASMLGPGSVALLQTLQQLRDGAVTAATTNGKTALVHGASALEGIERREYVRTVMLFFAIGTVAVVLAMVAVPGTVAAWNKLPASMGKLLGWLVGTVALLSMFVFMTAVLNALKEIGKLALLQLASPLVAAIVAWPAVTAIRSGHPVGMMLFLAIPAAASVGAAVIAFRGHRDELAYWFRGPGRWWSSEAARGFLSISGAMLVSGLAATATLLAVRASITHHQGLAITGPFDAAWNISMNHVTLILASVQAYYLPTLSSAKSSRERKEQIRGMLMLAALASVPVIVAIASLKPVVIGLLYSSQFAASPGFLRWTLMGDYLKVSSWVLATPMIAAGNLGAFLLFDLLTQAAFFGAAIGFAKVLEAAEGAAIGFLISYAIYFALCYAFARAKFGFRFGGAGLCAWLGGLLLVGGASASAWSDRAAHLANAACWIALAATFSAGFAIYMRRRDA